jgi:hypothetical protein
MPAALAGRAPVSVLASLPALMLLVGCGRIGFRPLSPGTGDAADATVADATTDDAGGWSGTPDGGMSVSCGGLTVEPVVDVYPGHGEWNDYVRRSAADTSWFEQPNTPCDGTETGLPSTCIHGGEKKKFRVLGTSDCTGYSARDALGAFDWICRAESGAIGFFLDGLKPDRGLRDLVLADAWRANSLQIYRDGQLQCESASATWWSNPVVPLPPGDGNGVTRLAAPTHVPGTIFTVDASRTSAGYSLELDRLAVITLNGSRLRYAGSPAPNCNINTGEVANPGRRCILLAGAQKFLWFEVSLDASSPAGDFATEPFALVGIRSSQFRHVEVSNATSDNFMLRRSSGNLLHRLALASSEDENMWLDAGGDNVFHELRSFNAGWEGAQNNGSTGNRFIKAVVAATSLTGLQLCRSTLFHATIASSNRTGLEVACSDNIIAQVLVINSGDGGIYSDQSSNDLYANVAAVHNVGAGIELFGGSGQRFHGVLKLGGNDTGCVSSATSAGIDASCQPINGSTHILRAGADCSASLVERTGDSQNLSADTSGAAPYSPALDWFRFDNLQRVWGAGVAGLPGASSRGRCRTGNCGIWDLRPASGDAELRDRSGDGVTAGAPFVPGGTCPAAAQGDRTVKPASEPPFLLNAVELVLDSAGDNDGLCESGESCVYSPHLATAHQGSGEPRDQAPCLFEGGSGTQAVTDVTLYGHPAP